MPTFTNNRKSRIVNLFISSQCRFHVWHYFRNLILIAFSNIILCQVETIRALKVSDLVYGAVRDVNHKQLKNHKNSTLKHFLSWSTNGEANNE